MPELFIEQSLAQRRIGLKQEMSLKLLQKGFIDLSEYIQSIEEENPFIEVERKKDITDFELLKFSCTSASGNDFNNESKNTLKGVSLHQYLLDQLMLMRLDKKVIEAAKQLIQRIDDSGYFLDSVEGVAKTLGAESKVLLTILKKVVQRFEPAGVGARNISECLLLQLKVKERSNKLLVNIIKHELILVAQNKLGAIAKKYGARLSEVRKCCECIRTLNPKPGSAFSSEVIKYVFPDIIVERRDGHLTARLTEDEMVSVTVNSLYAKIMIQKGNDEKKEFVANKLRQAKWLCESVKRRRETILKIAEYIIDYQHDFFENGCGRIRPLTMHKMAELIGVHESTVSRAAADKYLQCDWGIYELKYFFSPNVNGISAEALMYQIRRLIDDENKFKPYSDQRISDSLKKEGIDASRRTVAKYRQKCRIPSASQRRQLR